MNTAPGVIYEFGPFRMDPGREVVLRDGRLLAITPKAFDVLRVLVCRGQGVVSKDELMQAVWAGRVVEEANLSQCIFLLRKLLGDTPEARRYILTLPGKGYRFIAPVRVLAPATPDADAANPAEPAGIPPAVGGQPAAPDLHSTPRPWVVAAIGLPVVVGVLLAAGYVVRNPAPGTVAATPATAFIAAPFDPPKDSLVVLPFANLSGDAKQQYFSDGITEELTDALGENPALRVIAWDTAATLRDPTRSPNEIGRELNVAAILNGSVLWIGREVRVTAELVDTRTGLQLWSSHYDTPFADILAIQDHVSASIAAALNVKFAQADLPQRVTRNPEAHELVLKGRALMRHLTAVSLAAARKDFEQSIALDPDYADAHALLSRTLLHLTQLSDLTLKPTLPMVRAEAQKALQLEPGNADAWVALGNAEANSDPPDFAAAREDFRKALMLDPSNAGAHFELGNLLPLQAGMAEYREATRLDPAGETGWNNLAIQAQDLGDWPQAIEALEVLLKLDPGDVDSAFSLAFAYQQLRQYDKMIAAFDLAQPATAMDREQVAAGRLIYRSLRDSSLRPQALASIRALARFQSNQDAAGNLVQLYLALGETVPALALLESGCPGDPVGCSDLAVSPVYRPLHGNPGFDALAKRYTTIAAQ